MQEVFDAEVVESSQVSPSFQRVTLRAPRHAFEYAGFDQWFRFFFARRGESSRAPYGPVDGWYTRYREIPEAERSLIRNYTVRDARIVEDSWHIDVDFVLHETPDFGAARWAKDAQVGDRVSMLDQGIFFTPGPGAHLIVTDPTGLLGLEGICRSYAGREDCAAIVEIDHPDDRRELAWNSVSWVVREPGEKPGDAALRAIAEATVSPQTHVYITGESAFVLQARGELRTRGIDKKQIDFCGYWRSGKKATDE